MPPPIPTATPVREEMPPPIPIATPVREESTPPPAVPPVRRGLLYPCMILLCGVALIAVAASMESGWITGKPWSMALLVLDDNDEGIPPDAYEVYAYPVVAHTPSKGDQVRGLMQRIAKMGGDAKEFEGHDEIAVAVVMPMAGAAPLLASGRLPKPGAHEALAGDLVPDGFFTLRDGDHTVRFEVVGRLRRTVSSFTNAYMIIDDPIIEKSITPENDVRWGWLVPDGWNRMDELRPWIGKNNPEVGGSKSEDGDSGPDGEGDDVNDEPEMGPRNPMSPGMEPTERPHLLAEPELTPLSPRELNQKDEKYADVTVVQRQIRVPADIFWTTLAGLLLVAAAGFSMVTRMCLRMSLVPGGLLGPLFCAVKQRRTMWNTLHALLYLLFFYAMVGGFVIPESNYQVVQYVSGIFSKSGDLGYVGDAYASGDILRAALATFENNYVTQTLGMTFLVSLPGIPLGVLKTAGSFLLAGLALSPIWVDGASGYVFHSVTMAIEFEGYIIACFAVLGWTVCLCRVLTVPGRRLRELANGVRVLFAAALASGIVLAVAALYEAATLILLVRG